MFESEGFYLGKRGKSHSMSLCECKVSHCTVIQWINSLYSESACLFRLEGLTCQCCHEQKLSITNSQLQVTYASEIQLANAVEEMAFPSDVKEHHGKNCIGHVAVQYN